MAWVLANPSDELTASRSMSETRRPNRRTVSTRVTRKPRPPTCINSRMTHWPNRVKSVLVDRTARPVTAAAEVAVNSASMKVMGRVVIPGSSSNTVPRPISAANAATSRIGTGTRRLRCGSKPFSISRSTLGPLFSPERGHGRDATSRSFSRWPTANSVSPASSLVSAPGQGMRRSDRWIRSTVTS